MIYALVISWIITLCLFVWNRIVIQNYSDIVADYKNVMQTLDKQQRPASRCEYHKETEYRLRGLARFYAEHKRAINEEIRRRGII